jgi:hypothetical protein
MAKAIRIYVLLAWGRPYLKNLVLQNTNSRTRIRLPAELARHPQPDVIRDVHEVANVSTAPTVIRIAENAAGVLRERNPVDGNLGRPARPGTKMIKNVHLVLGLSQLLRPRPRRALTPFPQLPSSET